MPYKDPARLAAWMRAHRARQKAILKPVRILSLGAGVQSTAMLLMALDGVKVGRDDNGRPSRIAVPHAVIFADTGWEPEAVYENVARLTARLKDAMIPFYRISVGNIYEDWMEGDGRTGKKKDKGQPFIPVPAYVKMPSGLSGIARRQCTQNYKIFPIRQTVRRLMRKLGRTLIENSVQMYIGISYDEADRARESQVTYIENAYPLVDLRITREDCIDWMLGQGYPEPPRSACIGCPFHNDGYWLRMKNEKPGEFAQAVAFDHRIRNNVAQEGVSYLHSSLVPLDEVTFRPSGTSKGNAGDLGGGGDNKFRNDCSGLCGV